jgi:hypothetical protein
MNLLQQLDDVCPDWRVTLSRDPLIAAEQLGLLDETTVRAEPRGALNFNDERANERRMREWFDE